MSKRKKLLLSSIMCSLILGVSACPVSAETIESFNLDEMVVESSRNHKTPLPGGFNNDSSRVGLLGETEVIAQVLLRLKQIFLSVVLQPTLLHI